MARQTLGIALIGTGMWGARLATAVKRTPSLKLVTCFNRNEDKRNAFAAQFSCEAAPSFEAAIEHDGVQGVLLVTPNNVHAEQTKACAERGKHVFVEKPIAATTLTLQTKNESQTIAFEERDMVVEELDEFARCIRGEAAPETDAATALKALMVIRGAIASHEQGQIYTLES